MDWTAGILIVLAAVLGLLSIFFGTQWSKVKAKAEAFKQFVNLVVDATADDKVTEEEFKGIVAAGKALLSKW